MLRCVHIIFISARNDDQPSRILLSQMDAMGDQVHYKFKKTKNISERSFIFIIIKII